MERWRKHRIPEMSLIKGYVEWMRKVQKEACGYCAEPTMLTVHFDRPEHPWSHRDGLYAAWADEMWADRFATDRDRRGKPRPRGLAGAW